jgi:hypothetical protein
LAKADGATGVATVNLVACGVTLVAMWVIQSRARRSVEATQTGTQPPPAVQPVAAQPPPAVQPVAAQPPPAVQPVAAQPPPAAQPVAAQPTPAVQPVAPQGEGENLLEAVGGPVEEAPQGDRGQIVIRLSVVTLSRHGDGRWRSSTDSR